MAAKKFAHHFVPHHHLPADGFGEVIHHRAHALNQGALVGYLIIFVITIVGFYAVRINAPQILGTAEFTAAQIIELTNIKRAEFGLPSLSTNSLLANAAAAKGADMFSSGYWAHYSPAGDSPWKFITEAGYKYIYAGENLARDFNNPQSVVNAWIASPTHRDNILDENFKEIGVSVESGNITGKEGVLVVQMFGSSVSQIPTTQQLAQNPSIEEATQGETTQVEGEVPIVVSELDNLILEVNSEPATVLASRQFSISRIISILFVGLVFGLFLTELAVVSKKSHLSLKSSTLAHLGILALTLFALWWATAGVVI